MTNDMDKFCSSANATQNQPTFANDLVKLGGAAMLLSIGMMVKNEEKYLERCLTALQPILNSIDSELIVVDTGSTDKTVEIAKKFTDKVYFHEWTNDFAEMRNIVLRYAKGEWFFYLDADEIIDDYSDIIDFFSTARCKKANAAFFLIKNRTLAENETSLAYFYALRFFRNTKSFYFKGSIHEQPVYQGPVERLNASAVHYGYLNDEPELMEYKFRRNVELLKNELEKDPNNIYYWFQLAQSYGMYGDSDGCLESITTAYNLMKKKGKSEYRMNVAFLLAKTLFNRQQYSKTIEVSEEAISVKEGYFDLYFFCGVSHFQQGNYEKALSKLKLYLESVEKFKKNEGMVDLSVSYSTVDQYDLVLAYVCTIYKKLNQPDLALEYADRITDKNAYQTLIPQIVEIFVERQQFAELKELYQKKTGEEPEMNKAFLTAFENNWLQVTKEQKRSWASLFASEDSEYGILNAFRLIDDSQSVPEALLNKARMLNWRILPKSFGEVLSSFIERNLSVLDMIREAPETKLYEYLTHIYQHRKWFGTKLIEYLKNQGLWGRQDLTADELRLKTIFLRAIVVFDGLGKDSYLAAFNEYVSAGVANLAQTYSSDIISGEKVSYIKTNADAFMLYMCKANECFATSKVDYVSYLRKALDADNSMIRGIKMLQEQLNSQLLSPLNELGEYKTQIIKIIEDAINEGKIDLAKHLIAEYEDIVGLDAPLCSFKGILFLIDGKLGEARNAFLLGLQLEPENEDLLYNLEYLDKCRLERKSY